MAQFRNDQAQRPNSRLFLGRRELPPSTEGTPGLSRPFPAPVAGRGYSSLDPRGWDLWERAEIPLAPEEFPCDRLEDA